MNPLPTLFVSHGSPMHALHAGAAGETWRSFPGLWPRPRAILMISAHWETDLPLLTGHAKPELGCALAPLSAEGVLAMDAYLFPRQP